MTSPGWYYADGDPVGTTRYWDGERWVGDPQYSGPPGASSGGYIDRGASRRFNLASPGARIGARLIDFVIGVAVLLVFAIPLITGIVGDINDLGPNPSDAQVEQVLRDALEGNVGVIAAVGFVGILWDFLWVGLFGGTPGKLILGLRVARADNGANPPGWGKAALRALNRIVAVIPGVGSLISLVVGLASLVMLFADDQHRTVMDRVASTVVIRK